MSISTLKLFCMMAWLRKHLPSVTRPRSQNGSKRLADQKRRKVHRVFLEMP